MSSETGSITTREAGMARLLGGGQVVLGAIGAILAFVLPAKLVDYVTACNTVGGYLYGNEHPTESLKCQLANTVTDYKWIVLIVMVFIILEGTALFFYNELKASGWWEDE
jgi:hypothetical protein